MYIARGAKHLNSADIAWTIGFSPRVWCLVVEHRGMVLDTRFVPAAADDDHKTHCISFLLHGTFAIHDGPHYEAPCALVLRRRHIEGANGVRPFTFRAAGEPYAVVELHVRELDLAISIGDRPRRYDVDASVLEAARAVLNNAGHDDSMRTALSTLLAGASSNGLLRGPGAPTVHAPPRTFEALWRALRPMIERLYLTPTLQELGSGSGLSTRQIDRHVRSFVSTYSIVGEGWRAATLHLRLKLAIMLLSAADASVAEVADAVGYQSTDAMARAFRDAGLAAPSAVQEQLHATLGA